MFELSGAHPHIAIFLRDGKGSSKGMFEILEV